MKIWGDKMKLKVLNVYSKKSRVFYSFIYIIILISLVLNFYSLFFLYLDRKSEVYYFLVFFYSALFSLAFLIMFIFHSFFFKQLNKTTRVMRIFKGNERFLISFIQRVNELYTSVNELYTSVNETQFQDVKNILSDISEILNKLSIKENQEGENIGDEDVLSQLEEIDESINMYFFQSISLIESLIRKTSEFASKVLVENKKILNDIICPTYISLEISKEWKERIEKIFNQSLSDTFKKITFIKDINESNSKLIKDTVDSFIEQQKNSSLFLIRHKKGLDKFFSHIENEEQKFFNYIEEYYKEFEKIASSVKNIESISETMKVVSLNMNIEASKTHGNKAFAILAKELQTLSERTEKFAKEIEKETKISLIKIREEKEKQIEELRKLNELINISKTITMEYDKNIQELNDSLTDLIKRITENNEKNKNLIFDLFKSFQEVSITREELVHKDSFITRKMKEIKDVLLNILEEKNICKEDEQSLDKRKAIFEELLSLITTKREKEFLKELYITYLNEELIDKEVFDEKISKSEEDVIIF